MGKSTDNKYKDAKKLEKSVKGVQTRLTQAKLKEVDAKYNADIAQAKTDRKEENNYVGRRDNGLIDRKVWRCGDQISLYDISDLNGGKYKAAVYYEQDKDNNPREEQFEHMIDMEFEDLETATMVFKAMCAAFLVMMSPVTENHIVGKPYKVELI